jgi:hypothetical protein
MDKEVYRINKNIILGNGQISQALQPFLNNFLVYDKGEWNDLPQTENNILNICIPYTQAFESIVSEAINIFSPKIVLVHSTVKPGTCESLKCAYSPIMGRHENDFKQDIQKYVKYVACNEIEYKSIAKEFDLMMNFWGENTAELEYSKIMSTTYMAWNLIFQKLMHKDCEDENFDFDKCYKLWNENYNNGAKEKFKRPIYDYDSNPLFGGHCLSPNLDLYDNFMTKLLKEWVLNKGELNITSHRNY